MSHLIQIGNSQGVRIPKSMIQQAGLANVELTLTIVPDGLLITPRQHHPRKGWSEAFKSAATEPDILLVNIKNKFDEEDWEW